MRFILGLEQGLAAVGAGLLRQVVEGHAAWI